MPTEKLTKKSIAIYDPEDVLERAIQEASYNFQGERLPMYHCKLMAQALISLKIFEDSWFSEEKLLYHRVGYFFMDTFIRNKEEMVFVTHLLFLRDILENNQINSYLHSPPVFMTGKLSHYLFREYPVHIRVDVGLLRSENHDIRLVDIGGFLIADRENVTVKESILEIDTKEDKNLQLKVGPADISEVRTQTGLKVAVSPIGQGVFQIDEHERVLEPDMKVWDKERKTTANIYMVEPGETGEIGIVYADGFELTIPKGFFDSRFVVE